jgi:pimeloyl-ACP methyl ester carboxylesterase
VIVAHSMAGLHAEALARRRPDLVAALVLADSSVEWRDRRPGSGRGGLRAARLARGALAFPPLRALGSLGNRVMVARQSHRRLTEGGSPLAATIFRSRDAVPSVIAEHTAYAQQAWDLARLRESNPWPGIPTVVLTAAGDGGSRWVADQRRLADLLQARQVVIGDSRHLIMLDRPDAVVDAIRSILGSEADHG